MSSADSELKHTMVSIRRLIDSMSAEGILGTTDEKIPSDEQDEEAIEFRKAFTELENWIKALPPDEALTDGWLSFIQKTYRSVFPDARNQRMHIISTGMTKLKDGLSKTSTRREKFKILYNSLYYKSLPCLEPGIFEDWLRSWRPTISRYNQLTLGLASWKRRPVFSWRTSNPRNILQAIRIQELTLQSLTKRMIRILETIHKTTVLKMSKHIQVVEDVGLILQDTILSARCNTQVRISLDYLIEQASDCISILELVLQRGKSTMSHEEIITKSFMDSLAHKIAVWQNSLTTLKELQAAVEFSATGDILLPDSTNELAAFGTALAAEVWLWNASDEELSAWNSGQKDIPLDWLCCDGLRVVSDQLSYANICKKIEANLGVKVLFDHASRHQKHLYSGVEAGFSCVAKVTLESPIEYDVSDSAQRAMGRSTTESITEVAVKIIRVGESEQATCLRIAREARAWAQLKHDHINPLLGLWMNFEGSAVPCFISPWASEGSLPIFLTRNPDVSRLQRLRIMRDVADALSFMHGRDFPVVHGDLRGSNVLIHHNKALVCDFGISQITDGISGTTTAVHGDWKWMGPEYFEHGACSSAKGTHAFKTTTHSDVYSFASVFVEAFTGRVPWQKTSMHKRAKHPRKLEDQPEEISDEHWKFLTECWFSNALLRPTARDVRQRMQNFVREADIKVKD